MLNFFDQYKLAALLIGALICTGIGAAGAWKVQGWRLDAANAKYDLFVEQVKSIGEIAQVEADLRIKADKQRKEQSDAENKRTLDSLRADIKRLRDARSGGGFVPAAPAGSSRPDLACFDRTELEQSIRTLDTEVSGIADKGSETTVDLNTAKKWAQNEIPPH